MCNLLIRKDIRQQYGNNRYELIYKGNQDSLIAKLMPYLTDSTMSNDESDYHKLLFNYNNDTTLKEIISIANEVVEISSIVPSVPSMDEIFIKTVDEYNKAQK